MTSFFRLNALGLAAALATALPALAETTLAYRFTQTGFADGAIVSGWFIGRDDEADGTLLSFELSDFNFSFSGNRAAPAFTLGIDNLAGLVFDIGSTDLQHLAVVGPDDSRDLQYDAFGWPGFNIPGRVSDNLTGLTSITWERLELTPISVVPEPHAAGLLLAGLAVLGTVARRRLHAPFVR
jgi:hypothetical protein